MDKKLFLLFSLVLSLILSSCNTSPSNQAESSELISIKIVNVSDISKVYDKQEVSAPLYSIVTESGDEVDDSKLGKVEIKYKLKTENDAMYTSSAPCNAGEYSYKIDISEGSTYSSCTYTAEFIIEKAIPGEDNYSLPDNVAAVVGDKLSTIDLYAYNLVWKNPETVLESSGKYVVVFNSDTSSEFYNPNYTSLSDLDVYVKVVSNLVNIPTISKNYVYSGTAWSISESDINGFDSSKMQIVGEKSILSAIDAGQYAMVLNLIDSDDSCWSDRRTGEKEIYWTISKAAAQGYKGSAIELTGTYSEYTKLSDYSLSDWENVYWKDGDIIPTCDITLYDVIYNINPTNYEDYEFKAQLTLSQATPVFTVPTGISAQAGKKLSTVSLPSLSNGVLTWTNPDVIVSDKVTKYSCTFTPNDTVNYKNVVFDIETTVNNYPFNIVYSSGSDNCYKIVQDSASGEYIITFSNMTSDTVYSISGILNGSIVINGSDDYKFTLNLDGIDINSSTTSAITVLASDKVTLVANKSTTNTITDNRDAVSDDETQHSACIYSAVDLTLSGYGTLNVISKNNNGIHTKDDLKLQYITLNVTCVDNALKGNDSVTISSGSYTLISKQGDAIKTKNSTVKYNTDGDSSSGVKKIQGDITITGGTFVIHAGSDGIDASHDVIISQSPVIDIYTSTTYSSNVETVTNTASNIIYVRSTTTSYKYSIYFYNSSSDGVWKNSSSYETVTSKSSQGGMQGPGGAQQTTYYYYPISKPSGYNNIIVYVYSSSQSQGQNSSYYRNSGNMTINSAYDTIAFSTSSFGGGGRPGSSSSTSSQFNWTSYGDGSYSMKGIKADNEINISGGTIAIKSYDDSIHANNDTLLGDEDDTSDDYYGKGNVTISGGTITLTTKDDGVHADQDLTISGGSLNVLTAYEGIEANRIFITGGESYVYATDDAANAATCNGSYSPLFSMSAGYLDLDVASGDTDTLDSNGDVTITGGTLIVKNRQQNSTSQTGGTIDLDGTLSIKGGYVASIGCWCNEANMSPHISSTSTTLSSGNYIVKNSSGTTLFSFKLDTSYKGYRIYAAQGCSLYCGSTKVN